MIKTVLITGPSGHIGRHAAAAFEAAGWTVRRFRRGTDMVAAAEGADIIVNGMNPPNYHNWAETLPRITEQHIAAARASGAMVILPGNIYSLGDTCPGAWDETAPHRPTTRKGRVRAEVEEMYRASDVQTLILRAGNFIDPEGDNDIVSLMVLRSLGRGRITFAGTPGARQAWCYLPDWARAAVALAEKRDSLAAHEVVPFAGFTLTWIDLAAHVERQSGQTLRQGQFPWWMMTLLSPVWGLAREMREMRYLYSMDHALDGARLRALLPEYRDTPVERALSAKLAQMGKAPEHVAAPALA